MMAVYYIVQINRTCYLVNPREKERLKDWVHDREPDAEDERYEEYARFHLEAVAFNEASMDRVWIKRNDTPILYALYDKENVGITLVPMDGRQS
jgi:hypothetical protein